MGKKNRSSFNSLDEALSAGLARDAEIHQGAGGAPLGVLTPEQEDARYWEERLRNWYDVEQIDDSPYQPPFRIDAETLGPLKDSLTKNGQLQPGLGRPHPTRPGRIQLAAAHRRKYAIAGGANGAPSDVPFAERHRFIGKLWLNVQKLTDEQMIDAAFAENDDREDFTVFDRAHLLLEKQKLTPGTIPGKLPSWEDLEAEGKLPMSARHARRILQVLRLPEKLQRDLMAINISGKEDEIERPNEKHCRALLLLQPAATDCRDKEPNANQKRLLHTIEQYFLSGNLALQQASELNKKLPELHNQEATQAVGKLLEDRAQESRATTRVENQQALAQGHSHLRAVDLPAPQSSSQPAPMHSQGSGFVQAERAGPVNQNPNAHNYRDVMELLDTIEPSFKYISTISSGSALDLTRGENFALRERLNGLGQAIDEIIRKLNRK